MPEWLDPERVVGFDATSVGCDEDESSAGVEAWLAVVAVLPLARAISSRAVRKAESRCSFTEIN